MLRELKTFVAVARYGTFAAAGQQVGLTQSAVSAQMRVLEQRLRASVRPQWACCRALMRRARHALPLAEQMLALYAQMARPASLADWQRRVECWRYRQRANGPAAEALPAFRLAAPGVELKLVPGVSLQLLSQVDAGELDLALLIAALRLALRSCCKISLAREPFVLITPLSVMEDDPLQILAGNNPFVRYDRHSFGGRQVSQFLREQRLHVREALELDELDAIVRMVECGRVSR